MLQQDSDYKTLQPSWPRPKTRPTKARTCHMRIKTRIWVTGSRAMNSKQLSETLQGVASNCQSAGRVDLSEVRRPVRLDRPISGYVDWEHDDER